MMLFTRDYQRGECCTVTYDAVHEGLPERGKCCTVTYDAVHEGLPERGKCCTVTYDAVHEGLPDGEMLHGNMCYHATFPPVAIPHEQHHMLPCNISPLWQSLVNSIICYRATFPPLWQSLVNEHHMLPCNISPSGNPS